VTWISSYRNIASIALNHRFAVSVVSLAENSGSCAHMVSNFLSKSAIEVDRLMAKVLPNWRCRSLVRACVFLLLEDRDVLINIAKKC
jgi:hypothetical protein